MCPNVLVDMTPVQIRQALRAFNPRYAAQWTAWIATVDSERCEQLGRTLRKWNATRPYAPRWPQSADRHSPPFLDDVLRKALPHVKALEKLDMRNFTNRTRAQERALKALWNIFRGLAINGEATCLGISKATLLLTRGRIGPAFDTSVCNSLRLLRAKSFSQWLADLDDVARDIRSFEQKYGTLTAVVPKKYAHVACGRLYDMIVGPRVQI
jgi:hypothetical protein